LEVVVRVDLVPIHKLDLACRHTVTLRFPEVRPTFKQAGYLTLSSVAPNAGWTRSTRLVFSSIFAAVSLRRMRSGIPGITKSLSTTSTFPVFISLYVLTHATDVITPCCFTMVCMIILAYLLPIVSINTFLQGYVASITRWMSDWRNQISTAPS
jgi:hypothetical protein